MDYQNNRNVFTCKCLFLKKWFIYSCSGELNMFLQSGQLHGQQCKGRWVNRKLKDKKNVYWSFYAQRFKTSLASRGHYCSSTIVPSASASALDDLIFVPLRIFASSQPSRCPLYYLHPPVLQHKHHPFQDLLLQWCHSLNMKAVFSGIWISLEVQN